MQMSYLFLLIGVAGVIVIGAFVFQKNKGNAPPPKTQQQQEQVTQAVPLPTGEDIVRNFYALISEERASDAVDMMKNEFVGDESAKQMWGVQFNSFSQIAVSSIEPSMKEEWTDSKETYKVTLDVKMKPEAASAPIPNYGYGDGSNIRWVTVEKGDDESWEISEIATGP